MSENLNNLSQEELIKKITALEEENKFIKEISAMKDRAFFQNVDSSFEMLMAAEGMSESKDMAGYYQKQLISKKDSHKLVFAIYSGALFREGEVFGTTPEKMTSLYHAASASGVTEAEIYAKSLMDAPNSYGLIAEKIITRAGVYNPVYHNQSQMYDGRYDYDFYPEDNLMNKDLLLGVAKTLTEVSIYDPFSDAQDVITASKAMGKLYSVSQTEGYIDDKDIQQGFDKYLSSFIYNGDSFDHQPLLTIIEQGIIPVDSSKIEVERLMNRFQRVDDSLVERFNTYMQEEVKPLIKYGLFNDELKGNKDGFFNKLDAVLPDVLKPHLSSHLEEYKQEIGLTASKRMKI